MPTSGALAIVRLDGTKQVYLVESSVTRKRRGSKVLAIAAAARTVLDLHLNQCSPSQSALH